MQFETRILLLPGTCEERCEYLDQICVNGWQLVSVVQRGDELEGYLQRRVDAGFLYTGQET